MKKGLMIFLFTAAICCCVLGIYMTMDSRITEPTIDEDASLLIKDKVTKDDAAEEESQEAAAPERKSAEEIAKNLELIVTSSMLENGFDESQVGIVVHDYVTDAVYAVNADSYFTAGSTYKVPLAMLYYEKLAAGEFTPERGLYYDAAYYEEGGPIGATYLPGDYISVEELLHAVIVDSDNTAAHILYENLGGWVEFKKEVAKYSSKEIIEETDDTYYFYWNEFTASYMNDVLDYLYDHRENFETLIADLTEAKPNDYLNGVIGGTKMAQKYGQYEEAENALGFSTSGRPYSIVVYTSLGYAGREWMGELNALIWDYFAQVELEEQPQEQTDAEA